MQNTGDALRASLAGALGMFMLAIPRIIGFLLVLLIGWFIASLIARAVAALLHAIKFNDLAYRSGIAEFVRNMGVTADPTGVVASVAKWFVRLIVLVVAFDTLRLPAVSQVLQQLLLWLPNLVVALVILIIAGLAATALSNLVRGATAEMGLSNADMLARITKIAIWAFAIVIAINQLGIAATLINTLLIGIVGAFAIAIGLAFGLGGRDQAAQILRRVSQRANQVMPRVANAAGTVAQQASASIEVPQQRQPWTAGERRHHRDANYRGPERRLALT